MNLKKISENIGTIVVAYKNSEIDNLKILEQAISHYLKLEIHNLVNPKDCKCEYQPFIGMNGAYCEKCGTVTPF